MAFHAAFRLHCSAETVARAFSHARQAVRVNPRCEPTVFNRAQRRASNQPRSAAVVSTAHSLRLFSLPKAHCVEVEKFGGLPADIGRDAANNAGASWRARGLFDRKERRFRPLLCALCFALYDVVL